ncbi:MAG: asparaginase [Rubrimonas sp.]
MTEANPVLVEATRGDFVERAHRGAWAVCDASGAVVAAAGDVERAILPRSAIKLFQALPLVESGAAEARRLDGRRLALACASHQGSSAHAALAAQWLNEMGLGERHLMCGPQIPSDAATRQALRDAGSTHSQLHNNCSGKHVGFLTVALQLGAPVEDYVARDHPVQQAAHDAFAESTGEEAPLGWAVDGCSAPNFAARIWRIAAAAARVADPRTGFRDARRAAAAALLRDAMMAHPFEVAGDGRACTELMEAAAGRAAIKTGADGCFVAYLPERGLGIALKMDDGDAASAECAIAALLARFGAVEAADPRVRRRLNPQIETRRGVAVGVVRPTAALTGC